MKGDDFEGEMKQSMGFVRMRLVYVEAYFLVGYMDHDLPYL
jgi:hypothetical protein